MPSPEGCYTLGITVTGGHVVGVTLYRLVSLLQEAMLVGVTLYRYWVYHYLLQQAMLVGVTLYRYWVYHYLLQQAMLVGVTLYRYWVSLPVTAGHVSGSDSVQILGITTCYSRLGWWE